MDLLGQVDDQMLKDIGVSIGGHRPRIRNAIAKLTAAPVAEVNLSPYGQNNYRTLGASGVRRIAASPLPFFIKNRLIVFERAAAANARLSSRARQMIVGAGAAGQRYLTAVELVLLFTPRLVGKNAGVHPAARGIVPLLRSTYPQSAATMR
jgi:hypothetical protein